jgi:hypothetical protein
MDFDELKRLERARIAAFEKSFNEEMRRKGDPRTLDDLMGIPNKEPSIGGIDEACLRQMGEAINDILELTSDEDFRDVCLRAVGLYRSVARHVDRGGTVKFVFSTGEEKTLKVRLK